MPPIYHFGFIIEQTLGHITHTRNLQNILLQKPEIEALWGLPAWETSGISSKIPVWRSNWAVRSGLRARRELEKIEKRMDAEHTRLDALFFHTQTTAILAPDWIRRYPSVISLDGTPLQMDELGAYYDHKVSPPWLEALKLRIYQDRFRHAKRVVAWSEWTRQGLINGYGVPPEKVIVIPPGVDPTLWARPIAERAADQPVRILFVGGDLERKGGLLLLNAFRKLRACANSPVELHLVTRSQVQPEEGISIYHNMQPNSPALIQLYHQCDIFCLPTFGDCLAMVLVEAGAAGLPSVSTRVAGIPEVIRDGVTGILTPPGDEEKLYDALLALVNFPELRAVQGEAAVRHIRKQYDSAQNVQRLLDLMKEITHSSTQGQKR